MNFSRLTNRSSQALLTLISSLLAWGVAVSPTWAAGLLPACAENGDCSLCDVVGVFINFAALIVQWLGLLAILMFIIGGVWIILSGGNAERTKRGRQIIFGTLGGSLLVVTGWIIINFALAALLNADLSKVTIFPTSQSDSGQAIGGDTWYELACNPIYADCGAEGVTDGSLCSDSSCEGSCVCDSGACVSYCEFEQNQGTFSAAVCQTSTTACASGTNAVQYWCPLDEAGNTQVCCVTPNP